MSLFLPVNEPVQICYFLQLYNCSVGNFNPQLINIKPQQRFQPVIAVQRFEINNEQQHALQKAMAPIQLKALKPTESASQPPISKPTYIVHNDQKNSVFFLECISHFHRNYTINMSALLFT